MAQNAAPATSAGGPPPTQIAPNGVVTAANPRGQVGGNRKKQKRRAKEQAKKAALDDHGPGSQSPQSQTPRPPFDHDEADSDPLDDQQGDYYSEDDDEDYPYPSTSAVPTVNGLPHQHLHAQDHMADAASTPSATSKKKNKKKRRSTSAQQSQYPDPAAFITSAMGQMPSLTTPQSMSGAALRNTRSGSKGDRIWNTSTNEERQRIKEFWLSLSEEERKSLLKIEKEAVLRKMKEQQKHSCSCTVCGRKRTAIEEELEVLYDAYYEELEQYAHQTGDPAEAMLPHARVLPRRLPSQPAGMPLPLNPGNSHHRTSRVHEIIDDDEEDLSEADDDDDDEEYSDDEEELYSDDEDEPEEHLPRGPGADFFSFGNSLTVKGGILTVADDLLKNDGKKFIEMMEQLAERRMQREQEAEYAAQQPPQHYPPNSHEPPLDDEEYDDDEEEYDSQEEYDDEEEESEMGGMTEEQRMEEGRRMFQIFAARMFEQRVLTAYREKVAAERQKKLLEELEDETRLNEEQKAKKARDAEKRKKKKEAQKQAKAEEKARREAEKAAEEAALREIEEKKREDAQRRKDEQRKKKEAERKAQEEERQRKEADRIKRQQEERERQQEADRKLREQKALEKKQRDETRKKEREEREAREREAKEKKAQDERDKREREAKAKAEREAHDRERRQQHAHQPPQMVKRPSQIGMVAVPPGLHPKQASSSVSSPHVAVATPAMPKPATPSVPRQSSLFGSQATSPKSSHPSTSKSTSPGSVGGASSNMAPKTILQKGPLMHHPQPTSPPNQLPLPGMSQFHQPNSFGGLPQMGGYPAFHQPHGQFVNHRQSLPGFPQPQQIGTSFQPFHNTNGLPGPPPAGMNGLGMMPHSRGFPPMDTSSAFPHQQMSSVGPPGVGPGFGMPRHSIASHSRNHSSDKSNLDLSTLASSTQPIARPTPIQRPSSVKPQEGRPGHGEVDDLSKHLGSSALLDDADDPLPGPLERRQSAFAGPRASGPIGIGSPFAGPARLDSFGTPGSSWTSPSMFGPPPPGLASASSWGAGIGQSWMHNGFGALGQRPSGPNRPLSIRLALCTACKQLAAREPSPDDFHNVDSLLRQIEANRPPLDSPISLKEIEDICETEGDAQNGGGLLHVRHEGNSFSVKFEPDAATPSTTRPPATLGEIGSPMPGHAMPAFGSSVPTRVSGFGSLGSAIPGLPGGNGFP